MMRYLLSESISAPKGKNQMASWDTLKQAAYRQSGTVPSVHFLLDASGSMRDQKTALLAGVNKTIALLKTLMSPLSLCEIWSFTMHSQLLRSEALSTLTPLREEEYCIGGGTWLKHALWTLLDATTTPGQHILIVFTDGLDAETDTGPVSTLMRERQEAGWLCVYLGAYPGALHEGLRCGFHEGNCLTFTMAYLAAAFRQLRTAMQRFLTAAKGEQKLLTMEGIFPVEWRK